MNTPAFDTSQFINNRRLITVCLPIHEGITVEAKESVERIHGNVIIIFNNETPSISNGDSKLLVSIANMITVGIQ